MQIKFIISIVLLSVFSFNLSAQSLLTGLILDQQTQKPIANVEIREKNSTTVYFSDLQGFFSLDLPVDKGILILRKEGYFDKKIEFNQSVDFGIIYLIADVQQLGEVTVTAEKDKIENLPLVSQTIPIQEFQIKVAHADLVYGLKQIPSIYTTNQGGGTGDSKISIRGFDPSQTAVLINDIPVNDMETGWVYWSNWSALTDVSKAVELQLGMGSKILPLATFGGSITLNTTKELTQNFTELHSEMGSDAYFKTNLLLHQYSLKNNTSFTAFFNRTSSDGAVDGTKSKSNTYYFDFAKKWAKHILQGFLLGAPQSHQQRSNYDYHMATLGDYLKYGKDYNYNFGYYNGKPFNWTENYFHKNLLQLKWIWQPDSRQKITTQIYASLGTGGGSYEAGNTPEGIFPASKLWRNTENGQVLWDVIHAYNSGEKVQLSDGNFYQRNDVNSGLQYINTPFNAGLTKISFTNKHHWMGSMVQYSKNVNSFYKLNASYHFRYTLADNFDRLANLLGADGFMPFYDQNNFGAIYNTTYPLSLSTAWNLLKNPDSYDKLHFHYQSKILLHSINASINYEKKNWIAFGNISTSMQQNQRTDYFNYLTTNPDRTSDWINQIGFSMMMGARYTKNKNSWFLNAGFLTKPNRFENLFLNYKNDFNTHLEKEKSFSTEIGYQFTNEKWSFATNVYNTYWIDKYTSLAYENPVTHSAGTAFLQGVREWHYGLETVLDYNVNEHWSMNAMVSVGNWNYAGKATGDAFDFTQQKIGELTLDLDGVKVGDAAQFTSYIQAEYKPTDRIKAFINFRYIDQLYSKLNMNQNLGKAIKLPAYELFDLGLDANLYETSRIKISSHLNIQNVGNKTYIAESHTNYTSTNEAENWNGIALNNKVFFGLGRTWSLGLKFRF